MGLGSRVKMAASPAFVLYSSAPCSKFRPTSSQDSQHSQRKLFLFSLFSARPAYGTCSLSSLSLDPYVAQSIIRVLGYRESGAN